ncbi:hypothetical protein PFICI_02835 [Pestalotiopsis fici W106-1]|uniref:Xylanolytic transcriptional activator regulatory domain-containing protein n=1 Tax=Pestalotiopsis fici (strain W106-1 / CGMCC3.15140) TaxID=1229662 RepID=W3XFK5_PESFW|nr:uncharacterized protein PFICI_02835 [Pestalotiopsis fici W106-1]ETS84810.1 hypothetical protein PFICI_02835 [Pestalotiopsis fici W106-1]
MQRQNHLHKEKSTDQYTAASTGRVETQLPLVNPLAFHMTDWVLGPDGKPLFMGTSSNWAFGRRVLNMTHMRCTGHTLSNEGLLFDSAVYDLKWDGNRFRSSDYAFEISDLPTRDHAIYLINSVKFHCGRLFYLFDEDIFMERFASFHEDPHGFAQRSPLWYVHYLLILAFGKVFLAQTRKSQQPVGTELFVQAMKLMPDFTYYNADPVEETQVLCCVALWLQCLNHRPAAHRVIGQALRTALSCGMHTEMRSPYLNKDYVERCRTVWWTIYVLERQITSLLGVPPGIAEESISTPFPELPGQTQKLIALRIQVQLSQILAKIDQTVYGRDGKLDGRYIGATQLVLRDIAEVTQRLESSLDLHANEAMSGISRVSAHLHLQLHQCIVLTTRPLLYIFLQSRLGQSRVAPMQWIQSESVKSLIQICIDSAQQMLRVLSLLQDQGLLENFLTFDLDAAFISALTILMAAAVDSSLLPDHSPWSQCAYTILGGMALHGNKIAELNLKELRLLESELDQILAHDSQVLPADSMLASDPQPNEASLDLSLDTASSDPLSQHLGLSFSDWNYELSSDQLINIADSLDTDQLGWPFGELAG